MKKKLPPKCQYCGGYGVDRYGEPCPCRMKGKMEQYYTRTTERQDDEEIELDDREE